MANWKYKVENGRALRNAIDGESKGDVVRELQKCYNEIIKRFEKVEDNSFLLNDAYELLSVLEGEDVVCDSGNEEKVIDWGFEDLEDLVNSRLTDFYDFCDDYKIWVNL